MKVLLVKTSSMGDIVHTFPALTDAQARLPGVQFHWVVEEAFAPLAACHPAVAQVIPCAVRRWRKSPLKTRRSAEWAAFRAQLNQPYDKVIDAQGLLKSAFLTRLACGPKYGLDKHSAREPWSARVLDHPQAVDKNQHAITRVRQLVAQSLGYSLSAGWPDYGLPRSQAPRSLAHAPAVVLIHGTTWPTKHWPEPFWVELAHRLAAKGCRLWLPWGNDAEKQRAERIAAGLPAATVMDKLPLDQLAAFLSQQDMFVAVDTGLAHLAAAAGLKGVGLYGPTDPALTGVLGAAAHSLSVEFPCAPCVQEQCHYKGTAGRECFPPCFSRLPPERVIRELEAL